MTTGTGKKRMLRKKCMDSTGRETLKSTPPSFHARRLERVRSLLEAPGGMALMSQTCTSECGTPLHFACLYGQVDIVAYLFRSVQLGRWGAVCICLQARRCGSLFVIPYKRITIV